MHVEWANAANDRDVSVLDATGAIVSQSAAYGDADEDAVLVDPPPGTYTAVVVNDDQVDRRLDDWRGEVLFASPNPTTYAPRRAGTFRCETPSGTRAERAARHEGGGDAESDDTQPVWRHRRPPAVPGGRTRKHRPPAASLHWQRRSHAEGASSPCACRAPHGGRRSGRRSCRSLPHQSRGGC